MQKYLSNANDSYRRQVLAASVAGRRLLPHAPAWAQMQQKPLSTKRQLGTLEVSAWAWAARF